MLWSIVFAAFYSLNGSTDFNQNLVSRRILAIGLSWDDFPFFFFSMTQNLGVAV